jgi:hypothetical protein
MKSVENAAGVMVIDPQHVAAWGGITVAGNIVGAAYAPLSVTPRGLIQIPCANSVV